MKDKPKLTWIELLIEISGWTEPIYVKDVVNHYDMHRGEVSARLNRLRQWGFIKFYDIKQKGSGTNHGGFIITDYGRSRVEKG